LWFAGSVFILFSTFFFFSDSQINNNRFFFSTAGYIPHGVHVSQNRPDWAWFALPRGMRRGALRLALAAKHGQGELQVAAGLDG
jgi:hypothetical protein